MKIVTYNLRAGGRQGHRIHWQRLINSFAPDILLMQETLPPAAYLEPGFCAANAGRLHWLAAPGRKWGSAIYTRSGRVEPIALARHAGSVVAAEVLDSDWSARTGLPLRVASLHVPAPYKRAMNEILDDIAALPGSQPWVLGGDFNLAVGVRHTSEPVAADPPWLLNRMRREFNLMSCWQAVHPNRDLAQTLRWARNPVTPYHCDGIFVPAGWYRRLEDCQVIADSSWHGLSDHNPVMVSLLDD